MALVAELTVGGALFGGTCSGLPDRRVALEEAYLLGDGRMALFLWFAASDPETVVGTLDAAVGVDDWRRLDAGTERSLFRVTLTPEARAETVYDALVDHDITVVEATETADGSRLQIRVPTREALGVLVGEFGRRSVPCTLHRLYSETEAREHRYGLSPKQREALVAAWESGYYRVPRGATLGDIGDALGISEQSVSQRLRRGIHSLVGATVAGGSETTCGEDDRPHIKD